MTSDHGEEGESNPWLLEPPGAGQVSVTVGLGEGAELSDEATEALRQLMEALHESEVSGFAKDFGQIGASFNFMGDFKLSATKCNELSCGSHSCSKLDCGKYSSFKAVRG